MSIIELLQVVPSVNNEQPVARGVKIASDTGFSLSHFPNDGFEYIIGGREIHSDPSTGPEIAGKFYSVTLGNQ